LDAVVDIRWDLFVSHRVAFGAVADGWVFAHIALFVMIGNWDFFLTLLTVTAVLPRLRAQ
jgi:hypothetical protein